MLPLDLTFPSNQENTCRARAFSRKRNPMLKSRGLCFSGHASTGSRPERKSAGWRHKRDEERSVKLALSAFASLIAGQDEAGSDIACCFHRCRATDR